MTRQLTRFVFVAVLVFSLGIATPVGATLPADASPNTTTANIHIEQPRFISTPVRTINENGTTVHVVRGRYLEITTRGFNHSQVTEFGVVEDAGTLAFDKSDSEYVLNTQGTNGTFHVQWTVAGPNQTRIHRAAIRVKRAKFAHTSSERLSTLKEDASRGAELTRSIKRSGDPDTPVEDKVAFGNKVRNFGHAPFSTLSGQFVALWIMRVTTPAGWIDGGITLILVYLLTRGLYAAIARYRKQLENHEEMTRREDRQFIRQKSQTLYGTPLTMVDAWDDYLTGIFEDYLGPNLGAALNQFWSVWGEENLKKMYASAMGEVGYWVTVTRDGDTITDLTVLTPEDAPDSANVETDGGNRGEEYPLHAASENIISALSWDDHIDSHVFSEDPDVELVDHLMVTNQDSDDDLISEIGVQIPEEFESRHAFMDALSEFIRAVMSSEFTDMETVPKQDRAVLNNLHAFTAVMDEQFGVPLDLYWRAIDWNADGLSRTEEADSVLSDLKDAEDISELDMDSLPLNPGGDVDV